MQTDFPNPVDNATRAVEWPPSHEIGIYISAGDELKLIGTARDSDDLIMLLGGIAAEWRRLLAEPDWYFSDFVS